MFVPHARFLDRVVIHRSLGHSFTNRQDVTQQVLRAAPSPGRSCSAERVLRLLISIPLRARSLLDRPTMVGVLIGISAHPVWIGSSMRGSTPA